MGFRLARGNPWIGEMNTIGKKEVRLMVSANYRGYWPLRRETSYFAGFPVHFILFFRQLGQLTRVKE